MIDVKYHPLIDCDTDGKEKVPMFFSNNESTIRKSHGTYLEEIVPKYYRLRSVRGISPLTAGAYTIRCPLCGKGMTPISRPVDEHRLALYCCQNCNYTKERKPK